MITKKINDAISIGSLLLHLIVIIYLATWFSDSIWKLFFSSGSDLYVQRYTANQFDKSAKYVASRNPFGQIIQPPAEATPSIVSQIKLTGVYVNTPDSSIAFIELNGQSSILKIGDQINGEATLTNITPNSIVVSYNGNNFNINLTGGSGDANTVQSGYMGRSNQSNSSSSEQNQILNNLAQHFNNYNPQQNQAGQNGANESITEQRNNLIKQFEEQRQPMPHENGNYLGQPNGYQRNGYNNQQLPPPQMNQAPSYNNNRQNNNGMNNYNQQR